MMLKWVNQKGEVKLSNLSEALKHKKDGEKCKGKHKGKGKMLSMALNKFKPSKHK
jgi:hypothetical protein